MLTREEEQLLDKWYARAMRRRGVKMERKIYTEEPEQKEVVVKVENLEYLAGDISDNLWDII